MECDAHTIHFVSDKWIKPSIRDCERQTRNGARRSRRILQYARRSRYSYFFHLSNIVLPSNVVVRTADTDCLVIGLGCKHLYDPSLNIWLEVGVQSNNSQRFINMNRLYSHFGETLCNSLPAYHALTGCDYTASFCRRSKVNPLKVLEKDTEAQHALGNMACSEDLSNECIKTLERYLCAVYGTNKLNGGHHLVGMFFCRN